jgi:initiation factor 1A
MVKVNPIRVMVRCTVVDCRVEYAQVVKMLGNGRLEAQCFDGEKRLAHIRGKMRKKVRFFAARKFMDDGR